MFPFYKSKEAGKAISADNLSKIQNIHDTVSSLGANCGGMGSGTYESYRTAEAALPLNTSHDQLRGHLRNALKTAHNSSDHYDSPYVTDVFPGHVVYSHQGQTYKRKYAVEQGAAGSDPKVTLGDKKKVHVAYVDSASEKESMRMLLPTPIESEEAWDAYSLCGATKEGVIITLTDGTLIVRESTIYCQPVETVKESAKSKSKVPICIIKPGWGSCAYYSKEMIQKTGPAAFKKGTQMFMDHATEAEESERPEGSVSRLSAVLDRDAYWDENGPKGAALYSEALVFSDYAQTIDEKGPYIGCSINAAIRGVEGEAEGRRGRIAEKFIPTPLTSVDFVTKAGAGGAPIVAARESARVDPAKETGMTEKEQADLRAENERLVRENAVYKTQQNKIVAMATVGALVREAGGTIKQSLLERVCESPKMTAEGKVDPEWAKAAAEDLGVVNENAGGKVTGIGDGGGAARTQESDKASRESYSKSLEELGVPKNGLEFAMEGWQ